MSEEYFQQARLRFDDKWEPVTESGCWIWNAAIRGNGYGMFYLNGRDRQAHRVSWEIHRGPIPDGVFVCHKCDVPCCVNPDHLFLDTHTGNVRDMMKKRRHSWGESHGSAKLTESDVIAIRKSSLTITDLASRYGVCRKAISLARTGATWKHLSAQGEGEG